MSFGNENSLFTFDALEVLFGSKEIGNSVRCVN